MDEDDSEDVCIMHLQIYQLSPNLQVAKDIEIITDGPVKPVTRSSIDYRYESSIVRYSSCLPGVH